MQGRISKLPTNSKSGEIEAEDGELFVFAFADLAPSFKGVLNLNDQVAFDLYADREAGIVRVTCHG